MTETRYRKGDPVRFHSGTFTYEGVVKEDRGPIGMKGRHLYLIEFHRDLGMISQVELPAIDLEPVDHRLSSR